ncbi:MAG: DUF5668 domain-containing protein [Ignavibacteriae bacterium]|nr:DUF5668 domain-containing protein [Ignavibacteriota bacterium]MCI0707911.1 DUF5668 domain-containing protein [Ignavibacteriota bacterium]
MSRATKRKIRNDIVFGILLFLFGTLILLDNVNIIEAGSVWGYWPLIMIVIGVNKILSSGSQKETTEGIWLLFLGLWFFVSIQHFFGLGFWDTWPMLLIGWGVSEIWKALPQRSENTLAKENHNAN